MGMFITLLIVTFLVATGVAFIVVRVFDTSIDRILRRLVSDELSSAWLKYLKFATYVVGISSGVRIHELEQYITPNRWQKDAQIVPLTNERWILEIYRTIIETLQGVAWLLLIFFAVALVAYIIVKALEGRRKAPDDESRA